MDDLRIGPADYIDSHSSPAKDGSKKRRPKPAEPEEEPIDLVTLHSSGETEEELPGYFPPVSHEGEAK